ncbi:MAG: sulfotransferase domain-containing protein [bacterium]
MSGNQAIKYRSKQAFAPDFLVIGAMRCGTTSLHNWLRQFAEISLPRMKETDFFVAEKNWARGVGWYRRQFDPQAALTGEVSPNYTKRDVFYGVAERVAQMAPRVKLIYIVRDPVERAISHYYHSYQFQGLPEPDIFAGSREEAHILASSQYSWQLEPWLAQFEREQFLFLEFAQLTQHPREALDRIAAHLGTSVPARLDLDGAENSRHSIGQVPGWWHSLRETRLGTALRSRLPAGLAQRLKSSLSLSPGKNLPAMPPQLKDRYRDLLHNERTKLEALTGLALEGWNV